MRKVKYAGIQMQCSKSVEENIQKADHMVREAAAFGAQIILLPELFERWYFCQERNYDYERDVNNFYNTVAVIDADGKILGTYRKTHIPDDHYYQEKFYFSPGNTGFKVWDTRYGKIGVGICWDQWFPEAAREMALMGAELLLYPTAIGSEPILEVDSMPHWRRCMQGHAACNIVPVVAANRIGEEKVLPSKENAGQSSSLIFYGSSFVTDATGEIVMQAERDKEMIVYGESDLDENRELRVGWGLFRDRRPEMYAKNF